MTIRERFHDGVSRVRRRASWSAARRSLCPRALVAALVLVAAVAAVAALAGTAGATLVGGQYEHNASVDDEPPTMTDGERVDATTVRVTIADNHDVAESTISRDQLVSEAGTISNVSVSESGSDATVTVSLEEPVNEENLTIAAVGNTGISDADGNVLGDGDSSRAVTVEGMDGVDPRILTFDVTEATGEPATVRIEATEELRDFNLSVRGASEDQLVRADFEQVGSRTYETTYSPPADGSYRFTLFRYTDLGDNTVRYKSNEYIEADLTPPETVASLDLARSENLSLVFDAGRTTDTSGVANYTWRFGDGTSTSGERVSHTFSPGNYTVTLEAVDVYGNAATDSLLVNLAGNVTGVNGTGPANGSGTGTVVAVRRDGPSASDAIVTIERGRAGVPIAAEKAVDGSLATREDVSLDGLEVTPSVNRSFTLGVSLTEAAAVPDVADDTETLGGLNVAHAAPDADIANVTISFSVARDRLRAINATADDVSLYRYDGGWQALPTTLTDETDEISQFRARSPGFSQFAIAAAVPADEPPTDPGENGDGSEGDGTDENSSEDSSGDGSEPSNGSGEEPSGDDGAQFAVTNVTLASAQIAPGDALRVNATVENRGESSNLYVAGLELNGTTVTTAPSPPIPAGESRTVQLRHAVNDTGEFAVAVNGTAGGNVTVAGGGGLFASVFGLLRPVFLFVVLPLGIVYGALKALAFHLGY